MKIVVAIFTSRITLSSNISTFLPAKSPTPAGPLIPSWTKGVGTFDLQQSDEESPTSRNE